MEILHDFADGRSFERSLKMGHTNHTKHKNLSNIQLK